MVLGHPGPQIVKHRLRHGRGKVLASETIPAAHHFLEISLLMENGAYVLVQGLSQGTRRLGPFQYGNLFRGGGKGPEKMFRGKGMVETNFQQADPFPGLVEVIHGFLKGVAAGSHGNDHPVRFRITHIIKQVVGAPHQGSDSFHLFLHDVRDAVVEGIGSFPVLEKDIWVLGRPPQLGMFRIHGPAPEKINGFPVYKPGHVVVIDEFDFLDFRRGPESIKKMNERQTGANGCKMGHESQVHGFLDGGRCQ